VRGEPHCEFCRLFEAADCFDGIDCTDNFCTGGVCSFKANNKLCPLLQSCSIPKRGCVLL